MKLIRKSVFETNSSSCHSLTLASGDTYEGVTPNSNNQIILETGDFGWSIEDFSDAHSKMSYVWIYMRDWDTEEHLKDMFKKVVFEHTGASEIIMPESETSYGMDSGYIDHQSVESKNLRYLFDSEYTLKTFLFNPQSSIHTDNDNHD